MGNSSVTYHESLDDLSLETRDLHRALVSLQEELEAVDWYGQRAEACKDNELKQVLLHNMREEIEHASMLLEWLRRHSEYMDEQLKKYLFSEHAITDLE